MSRFKRRMHSLILRLEAVFDHPFGRRGNPLRHLGTLAFFFFWIAAASGIYVYILFDTSVAGAHASIEYMTHDQWYLAGIMRSLHRYSSDAMVVTAALHMVREFAFDRYRGVRWFTWFTGVPILWLLYVSGVSGYWLIWDRLAQWVATTSMEWLDWLGIFGQPVANNFLAPESLNDRFFSLLAFIHIFAPLFLLFVMWIHLVRMSRPHINPPRGLAVGSLVALVVLSLVKPALSHPAADLATLPGSLGLDWFYLPLYPLYGLWGAGTLWGLTVGVSLILAVMPWLPPLRKPRPAQVTLEYCNGCARCHNDCPFGAITMRPRTDGRPFEQQAVVDPSLCTRCGICVGACPPSTPFRTTAELPTGIDLPDFSLRRMRELTRRAAESLTTPSATGPAPRRVLIFACEHGVEARHLEQPGVAQVTLPCIGALPPSFVDFVLSRTATDGVMLAGCRECDCHNRFGVDWTEQRLTGSRDPQLRKRVARWRVCTLWAGRTDLTRAADELADFLTSLGSVAADGGAATRHAADGGAT